ncbi:copper amine oxidase family protein [Actinidia rufa]|uniref:Amine oxidase n=1 Tax=Actinidia rufa TaxID=165716 RepID=A0A7J0G852_9ERIC|nr:copper amine oxidase family protein [Actinidia rufa]
MRRVRPMLTSEVTRHETGPLSGYPTMTKENMTPATWAPLSNADFNRTIIDRGIDLTDLTCLPISTGWFGESEESRRLIKVQCYSMKGIANFYMRPIKGLTVLLDMDTKEVIHIVDQGKNIPIPKAADTDYRFSALNTQQLRLKKPDILGATRGPEFCHRGRAFGPVGKLGISL